MVYMNSHQFYGVVFQNLFLFKILKSFIWPLEFRGTSFSNLNITSFVIGMPGLLQCGCRSSHAENLLLLLNKRVWNLNTLKCNMTIRFEFYVCEFERFTLLTGAFDSTRFLFALHSWICKISVCSRDRQTTGRFRLVKRNKTVRFSLYRIVLTMFTSIVWI